MKKYTSYNYNFVFDNKTGLFARWGKTKEDDPEYSPIGSEILDMEISTQCSQGCKFCYKSNTCKGNNMSFETFKNIFDKLPKTLTQIAFGIGDIDANKDLWKIMQYCRDNDVVPNITINGYRMTPEYYDNLAKYCGAVAVSLYDYDTCFNAVKELTDRGMKQINIHCLLSEETKDKCMEVLNKRLTDERLSKLNAIVFLWLKPKGRAVGNMNQLKDFNHLKEMIKFATVNNIGIGFDSCSAPMVLEAYKDNPNYEQIKNMIEPCESTMFSYYVNVDGIGYPCSFAEEGEGLDLVNCDDFLQDIWFAENTKQFRKNAAKCTDCNSCRKCSLYNLGCDIK